MSNKHEDPVDDAFDMWQDAQDHEASMRAHNAKLNRRYDWEQGIERKKRLYVILESKPDPKKIAEVLGAWMHDNVPTDQDRAFMSARLLVMLVNKRLLTVEELVTVICG